LVTTSSNIAAMFHPGLTWIDVTGQTVAVGDVEQNGKFVAPPKRAQPAIPTLAQLQAEIARLDARLSALSRCDAATPPLA
jgi:hypothetical protein